MAAEPGPGAGVAAAATASAAWVPIPPGGSDVQVLAAVAGSPTVFAGTAYGGVFRTSDRGATWQPANAGLAGVNVRALAASPAAGASTLYAGTESGLFRSDDAATSWHQTGFGGIPTAFAVAPSAPDTLYVADADAVYRSDDGGSTWTLERDFGGLLPLSVLAVDTLSPQHVYLGSAGVALISRSGGENWREVGLPGASQVFGLAVDPARPGTAIAATDVALFVTRNGGGVWSRVAGLPAATYTAVTFAFDAPGALYAATDRARGRLWKSTDDGATWNLVLSGSPFSALLGDPLRPQRAYAAAVPDGIFHGPLTGGGWSPQGNRIDASSVTALALDPSTTGLLYAVALLSPTAARPPMLPTSTFRVSADGGASWKVVGGLPPVQRPVADPAAARAAYALAAPVFQAAGNLPASGSTALFHTSNVGATWQPRTTLGIVAFDVAAAPTAPRTLFAAGYLVEPRGLPCPEDCQAAVAISADGGASWSVAENLPPIDIPLTTTLIPSPAGWFVRIDPVDARTAYLGEAGTLIKTVDGGRTWSLLPTAETLLDLIVDPVQPQRLYGIQVDGTFVASADGGQTWQAPGSGLPARTARALTVGAGSPAPGLYAATSQGVFASLDRGVTWAPLGIGLPASSVLTVAANPLTGTTIYAGVEGSGGLFALTPN